MLRLVPCLAAALLTVAGVSAARAQGESLEQKSRKIQSDAVFDLNGDGKVDDYERDLAIQNLRAQYAVNPNTGEIDKEKLKKLVADRKRIIAEARAREREQAVVDKLRERQARGQRLSEADLAVLRRADEAAEARRIEREREARDSAKVPRSQAAQRLAAPILGN